MTFDLVVVGGGVMGTPAAVAAQRMGARTCLVAPAPPAADEPTAGAERDGAYGAHHDESRLLHVFQGTEEAAELTRRSVGVFDELASDVWDDPARPLLRRTGIALMADPAFADDLPDPAHFGTLPISTITADDLTSEWPDLSVAADAVGYVERGDAGILNPTAVLDAFRLRGTNDGLTVVHSAARGIETGVYGCTVVLADGTRLEAKRMLVAAGASTNPLLPRRLALRLKTETAVYAYVDEAYGRATASLPGVIYRLDDQHVDDYYTVPGTPHPDGTWRLKLGANTTADRWLSDDEVAPWYRSGRTLTQLPRLRRALMNLYPSMDCREWESLRCAITYTVHGDPYIDRVSDGLFVATGGNGHSAKWGPALGDVAARLAVHGRWDDDLPAAMFQARYEDENPRWDGPELLADRRRP